ncbi:MAG: DHH family phosphoesterase [Lachnospirales bacterium]
MADIILPFPYVKIDKDLNVVEFNKVFEELFENWDLIKSIMDIVPNFSLDNKKTLSLIGDKYYDVVYTENEDCYDVFIMENTNINDMGIPRSNILVGLLILDNYAEVQENMEEMRLPHLMAVVERKIHDYFTSYGGITIRMEKDRYLFVINRALLKKMKDDKFKIVEQIYGIDMGNMPVTLSIGIGINGKTINQDMAYARGALDLALGRGGNQIVIKEDEDKYQFIGGDGSEVSRTSKVRARVKAYGLVELIMSSSDVMIMGHKNPDLDSLGSAAGIMAIAKFYGKKCHIVLNEVTSAIKALYDRLVKELDCGDIFITGEDAISTIRRRTLLVVVDTHRPVLCECPELLDRTSKKVLFDHHRKCAGAIDNCALIYHEAYASSTCELVTEMLMYIKGIRLPRTIVEGLLAGITVDTKNFAFKTGIKTFEASAYLKRHGADTIAVRRLFKNSFDEYVAMSEVVRTAEIFNGNMALSVLRQKVDNPTVLIAQAADELLKINDIEVSYVLCQSGNRVLISARSLGKINVQKLMEKLGGGGHQAGAAAQLSDTTVPEAIALLKEKIDEYLKEKK